ncbi:MAG: 5'/3'-nucleotidase SurE [Planctomycetota bacterium]
MKFLLTNDDGIDAPGLATLERVAASFGEVTVVAPAEHQSGCSHQVTWDDPVTLTEVGKRRYKLDGKPADCVRVGLQAFPETDWVLSGVNAGANLGFDIYYSGTVAAAREATAQGTRSIALSAYHRGPLAWPAVGEHVGPILRDLLARDLPAGSLWNVNFPDFASVTGPPERVDCRPDCSPMPARYVRDGDGFTNQWDYGSRTRLPGRDIDLCFGGAITVSALAQPGD